MRIKLLVDSGRYPSIFDVMRDRYGITGVSRATTTPVSVHAPSAWITPLSTPLAGTAIHDPSSIPVSQDELEHDPRERAGLVVARRHGQHRRAGVPLNRAQLGVGRGEFEDFRFSVFALYSDGRRRCGRPGPYQHVVTG